MAASGRVQPSALSVVLLFVVDLCRGLRLRSASAGQRARASRAGRAGGAGSGEVSRAACARGDSPRKVRRAPLPSRFRATSMDLALAGARVPWDPEPQLHRIALCRVLCHEWPFRLRQSPSRADRDASSAQQCAGGARALRVFSLLGLARCGS